MTTGRSWGRREGLEAGDGHDAGLRPQGWPRPLRVPGNAMKRAAILAGFWVVVTRIGEALNPGPNVMNKCMVGTGAAIYPKPLRPGFRDIRCSGFSGGVPGEAPKEDIYRLRIVTVNVTSWRSAVKYLERTRADVVLIQETRITADQVDRCSAQMARRGWQTLWTPALRGPKSMPNAGGWCVLEPLCRCLDHRVARLRWPLVGWLLA